MEDFIMDVVQNTSKVKEDKEDIYENSTQSQVEAAIGSSPQYQYILQKPKQYIREGKKIQRNDPCPCGATDESGKPLKYKKCCGKNA